MRASQSPRKIVGGTHAHPAGRSVALDFNGPPTKGVAGGIYDLVGVGMEHTRGYFGIIPNKASVVTLTAIQDLECEIKKDSGRHDIALVSIHHDDDQSFRGEVELYAKEKGWENTRICGYRPNSNSKCERRIGMLQQSFRTNLLVATGGLLYNKQLWDVGLKYSNYTINTRLWPDRPSLISSFWELNLKI
jgi:hypothetical protein